MARIDDAAAGLKAIGGHHAAILDAYLNHRGRIPPTADNESVIKSLLRHQLAWRMDDDGHVQLSRALIPTLVAVTRSYRRTSADREVAGLWQDVLESVELYREAKRRGATEDADNYLMSAYDSGYQLAETLRDAIAMFSYHISTAFSHVKNLSLRAAENRRVIVRASKLNDILESFDYQELQELAGNDPGLRLLLLKSIPKALEQCGKELVFAIDRLTGILHTINHQQSKSQLIDALDTYFNQDELVEPSIDGLDLYPPVLNICPQVLAPSAPYLQSMEHEEQLIGIVHALAILTPLPNEQYQKTPIADGVDEIVAAEVHPALESSLTLIALVEREGLEISAMQIYRSLHFEFGMELWLLTLVNAVNALPLPRRQRLQVTYTEKVDALFNGNFWVSDVRLSTRQGQEASHAA
ncbi:MAG: hypothetical protein ACJAWL_000884 [Motiliproteus sp.]|jgi:hypothetical protein